MKLMMKLRKDYPSAFLTAIASIFFIAFASYYVQFPGLVSSAGIEPVGRIFHRSLGLSRDEYADGVRGMEQMWIEADVICEAVAILGIFLSLVAASGVVHHGLLFMTLTGLYSFLVRVGGTFYSFQWDTLLIETGWITSMCYAPWLHLGLKPRRPTRDEHGSRIHIERGGDGDAVSAWPLRFLLFKLMFMSGVVKIQADCPTWVNLTALEYHFATQCLPGPLAWYAHQLHPFLLRISVALTLLIEIQASFLLIFCRAEWRKIGAYLQLTLQILIILSGNYNFFNLLTMALCLPCMEERPRSKDSDEIAKQSNMTILDLSLCFAYLAWSFATMFEVGDSSASDEITIKLTWTKSFCEEVIEIAVPTTIAATFLFVTWMGVRHILSSRKTFHRISRCVHLITCIACIGISSVPFLQLSHGLSKNGTWMMMPTRAFIEPWMSLRPFYISNGYGLFRRMTGVGDAAFMMDERRGYGGSDGEWGWAGLPPSVVQRPEIILEAQISQQGFHQSSISSRELQFRWKPGDITQRPRQIAPHQPRLDWQMWFAALGSYQHNPWLIHFIYKLLHGCNPVIELMDEPYLSSKNSAGDVEEDGELIHSIRALLFHYDFTRADTKWNRRIPGTEICGLEDGPENTSRSQWWSRTYVQEYLPALDSDNDSVRAFLRSQGFPVGKSFTCLSYEEKCSILSSKEQEKTSLSVALQNLCSLQLILRQLLRM